MLLSPHQLLHDTKSIFCHQVQFFYFFTAWSQFYQTWGGRGGPTFLLGGALMILSPPPNFCKTLSQSSVIKFSSFLFLPPEVIDIKPGVDEGGPTFSSGEQWCFCTPQLLQDTKLIFCHQVQFFYFLPPEVGAIKPGVDGGTLPYHVHQRDTNSFVPQLLNDTKSIFFHQFKIFCFFFYHLKSMITNLGWMGGGVGRKNPQIIWLHFPNNLEIRLVNAFVPPTFARHKVNLLSSSSVLLFFYRLKSVISNLGEEGEERPTTFSPGGTKCFCLPNFWMTQSQSSVFKYSFLYQQMSGMRRS